MVRERFIRLRLPRPETALSLNITVNRRLMHAFYESLRATVCQSDYGAFTAARPRSVAGRASFTLLRAMIQLPLLSRQAMPG